MTRIKSPEWPAVIHHRDDPELTYVEDLEQWRNDPDLCEWRYDDDDRLIDSTGASFTLVFDTSTRRTTFEQTGTSVSLDEFAKLVQSHLFAMAQTCVSKVELRNYADGFATLAMLED